MAINPYLNNQNSNSDQQLLDDLIVEAIQATGFDIMYCPRKYVARDRLYGEDASSVFDQAFEIEAYLKNVTGWEGRNDFLSKFNLQIEEQGKLTVSMKRFRAVTGLQRPYEGDLIYIPLTDSIYQLTFVEHESSFHQLGALQVWDLDIDLFNYSNQKIRTNDPRIDKFENEYAHAISFKMVPGGNGRFFKDDIVFQGSSVATATARGVVISFNKNSGDLKLKNIMGDFNQSQPINSDKGAIWTIDNFDEKELPNSPTADNKQLQVEGDQYVVPTWSKDNPFGEP